MEEIAVIECGSDFTLTLLTNKDISISPQLKHLETSFIPEQINKNVKEISCGISHAAALLTDSNLVVWGFNYSGVCNIPNIQGHVKKIICGGFHNTAILHNGTVVCWGGNKYGQCNPPEIAQNNILQLASGSHHTIALLMNGKVIGWGKINCDIPNFDSPVKQIFCRESFSGALLENNKIIIWGDNTAFSGVMESNKPIKKIACSITSCIALLEDKTVMSWGSLKENLNLYPIKDIACGDFTTTVLYENNKIEVFKS